MVRSVLIRRFAFALFALALLTFSFAYAESVQWNTQIPQTLFYHNEQGDPGSPPCSGAMQNTSVNVSYRAQATDATTGTSVCGTTIPRGTQVRFEFAPHTYQDISWFTTGFNHDSPYGDWAEDALPPADGNAWCSPNNYVNTFGDFNNETHIPLRVDPPTHSLSDLGAFSCGQPSADGSVNCTAERKGAENPTFEFGQTFGRFYFAIYYNYYRYLGCWIPSRNPLRDVGSAPISYSFNIPTAQCTAANTYNLVVPTQSISCPIIIESPEGEGPSKPSVSASGEAACSVGTPYSITATATDPDGDDVRYGVDWDANGTVDQFAPSSGYVPSGTSQSVSRTYATEGSKTVKVMAIDDNGLTSSWSTLTFSCTDAGSGSQGAGSDLGGGDGGSGGGAGGGATPNLTIRAIPSLVRTGETTNLHWSASNVTACTVTGDNGDQFQGTISDEPQGNETSAITNQTTYTLSCTDEDDNTLTQSTTVNVLPVWSEF